MDLKLCFASLLLLRDEAKGGRSSSIYTVLQHGRVT